MNTEDAATTRVGAYNSTHLCTYIMLYIRTIYIYIYTYKDKVTAIPGEAMRVPRG
jgi:hypothetical protein